MAGESREKEHYRRGLTMVLLLILVVIFIILFFIMLILYLVNSTEDRVGNIFIYQLDGTDWSEGVDLDVFYNEEFGSNTVAPYSSGTYAFMLQNLSAFTLEYKVELTEENEYDIALCYRLKRDGDYLVDDYARTDDFKCSGITIEGNSSHYFELEWYWDGDISDANDTLAGLNSSIYTLTITLSAKAAA